MITRTKIIDSATFLGCDPAAIMAVDLTESSGSGFLTSGEPAILFEPHIFWKQLKKLKIDPNPLAASPLYKGILYPVWGTLPYGKSSQQHARLQLACKINREAALMSASWGRYQIMGFNWSSCGCDSLQTFIDKMYKSEDDHLDMFIKYVKSQDLDDELIHKDFDGFALGYNGPQWRKNDYGNKLRENFKKAKLLLAK